MINNNDIHELNQDNIHIIINDYRGYFKLNKWTRDKLLK